MDKKKIKLWAGRFIKENRSLLHGGGKRTWQENVQYNQGWKDCLNALEKSIKEDNDMWRKLVEILEKGLN